MPDCQKHPICKDTPNGLVFIEKSCVRYWLCVGGYPRLQRCAAGLAVSPTSLKCELATTVAGCEPPPTTPSPLDANDSDSNGSSGNSGPNGLAGPSGLGGGPENAGQAQGSQSRPIQSQFANTNNFRSSNQANNGRLG